MGSSGNIKVGKRSSDVWKSNWSIPKTWGGHDNAIAVVPKDHIEATIEQVRQVASQEQPMAAEIR